MKKLIIPSQSEESKIDLARAVGRSFRKAKEAIEARRGSGECLGCQKVFPPEEIEEEFRITHPVTKETKLSLLCRACREIWATELGLFIKPGRSKS